MFNFFISLEENWLVTLLFKNQNRDTYAISCVYLHLFYFLPYATYTYFKNKHKLKDMKKKHSI